MCLQWDTHPCSCPCASSQGEHRESPSPSLPLPSLHNCFLWYCPSWEAASLFPRSFWRSPSLTPVLLASKTLQEHFCYCGLFLSLSISLVHVPNIEALENFRLSLKYLCSHQWGRAMVAVVRWQVVVVFFARVSSSYQSASILFWFLLGTVPALPARAAWPARHNAPSSSPSESSLALKSLKGFGF